jgi:hypothetical protein
MPHPLASSRLGSHASYEQICHELGERHPCTKESMQDTFLQAYIAAALWSTTDESTPEGCDPLDKNYGPADLAPETLATMKADCNKFQAENAKVIEGREEQAGHDFWLTHCGHGAGYFDGDWPEAGDRLTAASHHFGEINLYVGDDGLIYS